MKNTNKQLKLGFECLTNFFWPSSYSRYLILPNDLSPSVYLHQSGHLSNHLKKTPSLGNSRVILNNGKSAETDETYNYTQDL